MRTVNTILPYAQVILYTLLELMPSPHQKLSLEASLSMFFAPSTGATLPNDAVIKSPSALSRFLNEYGWPTLGVIRATRQEIKKQLLKCAFRGRRPQLQVIIDLTTLEKRGKFKAFAHLIQVLNGKRGLQLVVMYLVVGELRMPWAFRPWRGKDTTTPAQLGLISFVLVHWVHLSTHSHQPPIWRVACELAFSLLLPTSRFVFFF